MFKKKADKRFYEKSTVHYQYGIIMILVDRETGVHYLHTWAAQGLSLTPLLDENGNVIVEKEN